MSGDSSTRNFSTISSRARMLLMFQEAIFKGEDIAGGLAGASLPVDAQNHLTTVRLSNQRFNVPVADSLFTYRDPRRRGPRG